MPDRSSAPAKPLHPAVLAAIVVGLLAATAFAVLFTYETWTWKDGNRLYPLVSTAGLVVWVVALAVALLWVIPRERRAQRNS
jgi:hypothetical protein